MIKHYYLRISVPDKKEDYEYYAIVTGEHNVTLYEGTESIYYISKIVLSNYNGLVIYLKKIVIKLYIIMS